MEGLHGCQGLSTWVVSHPNEDGLKRKDNEIVIKCDEVHFVPNSQLKTKSSLSLEIKSASGDIKIIGTDDEKGRDGDKGLDGKFMPSKNGGPGSTGARGRNAYTKLDPFDFGCFSAGGGHKGLPRVRVSIEGSRAGRASSGGRRVY